jgi:hypothetical protein
LLPEPHPRPNRAEEASALLTKSRRVIPAVVRPRWSRLLSATRPPSLYMTIAGADVATIPPHRRQSGDQAALKQLVSDRRRHFVDESGLQLWIVVQKLYSFLFPLRVRLLPLLPQLLTWRLLVFLDDMVGYRVKHRMLGASYTGE